MNDLPIHGELNIEALVFRQIERTHHSALQDESFFAANVRLLLNMLPTYKRIEVDARQDEYTSIVETYQYRYCCGVPMGTPEKPINGSPYKKEDELVDWYRLLEIILQTFEQSGVTWKTESYTVETGKVKEVKPQMPAPIFKVSLKKEQVEEQRIKRCGVCGERIERGTGTNYNKQLIHKTCKESLAK